MEINKGDIQDSAALARLGLSDSEIIAAVDDISNILEHFALIQSIDTTDTATYDNATGLTNVTREDTAKPESLSITQSLLDRAPQTHSNQVKVPAVFEE